MEKQMIRTLRAEEIECRAAVVKENGLSLLLYKDARVDQRILDETFGPFGWKRSHQCMDGNLYCTVEVYDKESDQWISKQDVGTTGYSEKEKSQASDSFKRACFNWGIGRELYTAPFIWIPAADAKIQKKGDKFYCNDHFSVHSIAYGSEREIISLIITNDTQGKTVFELHPKKDRKAEKKDKTAGKDGCITKEQEDLLKAELKRTGVGMEAVKERYKMEGTDDMTKDLYAKVMKALAKTRSKTAA